VELESLLQRASAAPLGPLSFVYHASGPATWTLTVTLKDESREIRAERNAATEGLILNCKVNSGALPDSYGPWVSETSTDEIPGQSIQRLWLHGDGLSPALLLGALAALMQVAGPESSGPSKEIVAKPRIIIPPPPEGPKPVPIERPEPPGWNSFGRATPGLEPEAVAVADSSAPEVDVEAAPAPESTAGQEIEAADEGPEPEAVTVPVEPHPEPATGTAEPTSRPKPEPAVETVAPVRTTGYCRECGSPFQPDHAFCTNCGAKLNQAGE